MLTMQNTNIHYRDIYRFCLQNGNQWSHQINTHLINDKQLYMSITLSQKALKYGLVLNKSTPSRNIQTTKLLERYISLNAKYRTNKKINVMPIVKTNDFYADIANNVEKWFDTSNYDERRKKGH